MLRLLLYSFTIKPLKSFNLAKYSRAVDLLMVLTLVMYVAIEFAVEEGLDDLSLRTFIGFAIINSGEPIV